MAKKVNIIGAGIAGLSAGCYLQMNGFETEIFELHNLPGGLCTSWTKDQYTIDGCLHWLVGSSPSDPFYSLWSELVDMTKLSFFDHEEYFRVEDEKGRVIRVFTDMGRLEKEMLEKAPEDQELIMEFVQAVKKLDKMHLPMGKPQELMNLFELTGMMVNFMPFFGFINKWNKINAGEYSEKFSNPLLKKMFEFAFLPEMSMFFVLFVFVWLNRRSAGYPLGGSLKFSREIEKRYLDLGGKVNYHHRIQKINTRQKGDRQEACGVTTSDGKTFESDYVISAADGYSTIFEMLGGKFLNEKIKFYYRKYPIFPSYIQISLGVNRDLKDLPSLVYFPLPEPLAIDPSISTDFLDYRIFSYDPFLAPPGKTLITCNLITYHYDYWTKLRKSDPEKYKLIKKNLADKVIEALDKKLGGIAADIEMVDVSSPATVIRYTNNWKGSFEGWLLTRDTGLKSMKRVLPGLNNFYMCGQWVEPGGGVPAGLLSGRNVTQIICRKERKSFRTIKA